MSNTPNTKTAANVCTRCQNGGMGHQFRHVADGKCFACGRISGTAVALPESNQPARVVPLYWTRWRIIETIAQRLRRIESAYETDRLARAEGEPDGGWLPAYMEDIENPEHGTTFTELLRIAPDDVRTRAVAALAKYGIKR